MNPVSPIIQSLNLLAVRPAPRVPSATVNDFHDIAMQEDSWTPSSSADATPSVTYGRTGTGGT